MTTIAENGYVWVPRRDWDPDNDKPVANLAKNLDRVFIHHTVTRSTDDPCADARTVERVLDSRGLDGYSMLIHPTGTVLELAGFDKRGEHTGGHNSTSIGISFIGNYETEHPTLQALVACARTINLGRLVGTLRPDLPVENIDGHRDVKATACPGTNLASPVINGRSGIDWIRWFVATGT